ncbi:MAG TPA: hypothetical protein VGE90_02695 [Chitinophaga sp.]
MKYLLSLTFVITALLGICKPVSAQEKTDSAFKSLICKEWKLLFYEEDGEKFPPAPEQRNDRMFFYPDYKVKSIEGKKIEHATWKYNAAAKTLIVTDNETKEKMTLKLISLTAQLWVMDYKDPEGAVVRMHMAPVK